MKRLKSVLAIILSIAMMLGIGSVSMASGTGPDSVVRTDEIVLDGDAGEKSFIGNYSGVHSYEYKYLGYVTTKSATSEYRYLKIKYTGDITTLRLEFYTSEDRGEDIIWFNDEKTSHFETVDGSDIVLVAEDETECVIDLEASGIKIGDFVGFHMHYLEPYKNGTKFTITDARLVKPYFKNNDGIEYFIDKYGSVIISGCDDNIEELVIPEEIEGRPVECIHHEAFKNHTNLKSIDMPDSIVGIGNGAFSGCSSLTSVEIPQGVKSLSKELFLLCEDLETVIIPNGVVYIGEWAFGLCPNLRDIVIPYGVKNIAANAFLNCNNLVNVTIPDSVTTIGINAFAGCYGLEYLTLSNNLTVISDCSFSGCNLRDIIIPDSVTTIGDNVFSYCTNLETVIIPDSVTTIGEDVFIECNNLTICGYGNSAAHRYAIDNSIDFVAIDTVQYTTHVQTYGWESDWAADGEMSGTEGEAKRLEAIKIKLDNTTVDGGIEYRTHVQSYGWESDWAADGEMSGTSGEAKRLEAIQIRLTGDMAEKYDVYYRVHAQTYGWLGWAKNGDEAGTAGYGKRLEGIEIVLVKKGEVAPGSTTNAYIEKPVEISYRTHVQSYGWEKDWAENGQSAGTTGLAKRLEAIQIKLDNQAYSGGISYRTHVQSYGWLDWVGNGAVSGTSGQAKRLEAIQIALNGEVANKYDIYYRVHAQNYGWLGWAKNGQPAGTTGEAKRLEAIEIVLVKKGEAAPGSTVGAFVSK